MRHGDHCDVAALERKRSTLELRLNQRGAPNDEAEQLIAEHEALDWLIAQTPATDLVELEIKISRLAAQLYPMTEPMQPDCLEHAILMGLVRDVRDLNENARRR